MNFQALHTDILRIHDATLGRARRAVNQLLNLRNWLIGACIVEYEQNGEDRATYGERLLSRLADELSESGHRGLSSRNLKNFRQVALAFPGLDIRQTLSAVFEDIGYLEGRSLTPIRQMSAEFPALSRRQAETPELPWRNTEWFRRLFASLSFSHLLELSRIDESLQRAFYELECLKASWSVRELKRQRDSMLYERIGLSKDKDAVLALAQQGVLTESPATVLRDPYVLEFLGLESRPPDLWGLIP